MDACQVYLFGSPHLTRYGQPVIIPRRKQWGLLAFLILTRQPQERDTLATLLWPTYGQERARADLRRELARLHSIAPDLLLGGHTVVALQSATQLWVDVWAFEELLAAVKAHGHAAGDYCPTCLDHLRAAHALYVDDLLAGYALRDSPEFEDWLFFQQESLRSELVAALDQLAQMAIAGRDLQHAIAPLRQRLAIDPLHEESHRRLIWVYAHTGQRTAALHQFHQCQDALARELGVTPAPETLALYRQLAQATAPAGATDAAHRPAAPAPPHFWGREQELTQLQRHLAATCEGSGRVVLVTGEAGSGKTALLGQFAHQALAYREDLIVAGGCGTTRYGADAPFLPFRDIFAMLTGAFECEWAENMPASEQAARLRALLPQVIHALVSVGPHLVDNLLAGAQLLERATAALENLADYERLHTLVTAHFARAPEPDAHLFIAAEVSAVLHALAAHRPLLLILDNLQWADAASFDLLFHLGKRIGAQPILVVVAYRPSEIAPDDSAGVQRSDARVHHPLLALAHEFTRDFGAVQVDLDAVTPAAARAWLDELLAREACQRTPALRDALFAQTAGQPLFTLELLQLWREQGWLHSTADSGETGAVAPVMSATPVKTAAAIQRWLDRLSTDAARLLTLASVAGEVFTVRQLAAVQGWSDRRTLECVAVELHHRHRLITEMAGEDAPLPAAYRFVNPMIRTYLLGQLDQSERQLLQAALQHADH
jgi:DNA-binding SARP family transcriptional activator